MRSKTTAQALADVARALGQEQDVTDILAKIVRDTVRALDCQAGALMVTNTSGELELLSSTSHQASELELFQIQHDSGPCVEVVRTGEATSATSPDELVARWGEVGRGLVDRGITAVHSFPLRWRGKVLGAMNILATDRDPDGGDEDEFRTLGQGFADAAALAIVQSGHVPDDVIVARAAQAVSARTIIERAKGVLAYRHDVDMGRAYDLLAESATARGIPLTQAASEVVAHAAADL